MRLLYKYLHYILFGLTVIVFAVMLIGMQLGANALKEDRAVDAVLHENQFWQIIAGEVEPGDDVFSEFAQNVLPVLELDAGGNSIGNQSDFLPSSPSEVIMLHSQIVDLPFAFRQKALVSTGETSKVGPWLLDERFVVELFAAREDGRYVVLEVTEPPDSMWRAEFFTFRNLVLATVSVALLGLLIFALVRWVPSRLRGIAGTLNERRQGRRRKQRLRKHPKASEIQLLKNIREEIETLNVPDAQRTSMLSEVDEVLGLYLAQPVTSKRSSTLDTELADRLKGVVDRLRQDLADESEAAQRAATEVSNM